MSYRYHLTPIFRDGLEILENFDSQQLAILDDALLNNGIEYSVDSQEDISGSYGDTIEGSSENETINSAVSGEVYGGDNTYYKNNINKFLEVA